MRYSLFNRIRDTADVNRKFSFRCEYLTCTITDCSVSADYLGISNTAVAPLAWSWFGSEFLLLYAESWLIGT